MIFNTGYFLRDECSHGYTDTCMWWHDKQTFWCWSTKTMWWWNKVKWRARSIFVDVVRFILQITSNKTSCQQSILFFFFVSCCTWLLLEHFIFYSQIESNEQTNVLFFRYEVIIGKLNRRKKWKTQAFVDEKVQSVKKKDADGVWLCREDERSNIFIKTVGQQWCRISGQRNKEESARTKERREGERDRGEVSWFVN